MNEKELKEYHEKESQRLIKQLAEHQEFLKKQSLYVEMGKEGFNANDYILKREGELIEEEQETQLQVKEAEKKNAPFTQLDDVGMSLFKRINEKSPKAGNLFLTLAQKMDHFGVVVCSRTVMADLAGTSYGNVGKLLNVLIDAGLLKKFKTKGLPVYAMNHHVVWRSYGSNKKYALFGANVIMSQEEFEKGEDFDIRRGTALIKMAKKTRGKDKTNNQTEFPPPVGQGAEELEIMEE